MTICKGGAGPAAAAEFALGDEAFTGKTSATGSIGFAESIVGYDERERERERCAALLRRVRTQKEGGRES